MIGKPSNRKIADIAAQFEEEEKKLKPERYGISDWFVGTGWGQTTFLGLIGGTVIIVGCIVYANAPWILAGDTLSYEQALWVSWTMFTDPGTQTGVETDASWKEKLTAVSISLSGYIFFLSVMGIVVDVVRKTLDDWKTFRSHIVANDHTLVLGWTSKSLFLLQQLSLGQLDLGKDSTTKDIVVMADVTAEELVDIKRDVHAFFHHGGEGEQNGSMCGSVNPTAHIQICNGCLTSDHALIRASVRTSQQIIIMSPELDFKDETSVSGDAEDIQVLGTILSLTSLSEKMKKRGQGALRSQIIAEVRRPETLEWIFHITTDHAKAEERAEQLSTKEGDASGEEILEADDSDHQLLKADAMLTDMLAKQLLVRHAIQPEIGKALEELLGYEGQDLYIRDFDSLVGKTFGEVMYAFDEAIVIGLLVEHAELSREGDFSNVVVNPPDNRVVKPGDKILFISLNVSHANLRSVDATRKPKRHLEDPRAQKLIQWANDRRESAVAKGTPGLAPPTIAPPIRRASTALSAQQAAAAAASLPKAKDRKPMVVLVFGWSGGPTMQELLALLDEQVPYGSEIHIISEVSYEDRLRMLAPLHVPSWYKRGKGLSDKDDPTDATDTRSASIGATVRENQEHHKSHRAVPGMQIRHVSHQEHALLRLKNCEVHHHIGPIREPAFVAHMPVEIADVAIMLSTAHPSEKGDALLADASAVATLLVLEDLRQERLDFMERVRREEELKLDVNDEEAADNGDFTVPTMASMKADHKRRETKIKKGQITVLPDEYHGSAVERTSIEAAVPAQLSQCMVVCEIQDPRTQMIIERQSSKYDHVHYYRANKLVAALLAMVAQRESAGIRDVLMRLMRTQAPNFCLVEMEAYVFQDDVKNTDNLYLFSFWDLVVRVRAQGDILLGYTSRDADADDDFTESRITMNPSDKYTKKKWLAEHQLIVMSSSTEREHAMESKWTQAHE